MLPSRVVNHGEYREQIPPTYTTFARYLRQARHVIDQCGKRRQRRSKRTIPTPGPRKEKRDESRRTRLDHLLELGSPTANCWPIAPTRI